MGYPKHGWYCCVLALLGLTVAGCGGGENLVTASGKVVDGGQPVVIEDYEEGGSCLEVEFFPLDAGGQLADAPSYPTFVKEDGSFEMDGPMGEGIPAGKYRVAVYRRGETEGGPGDEWGGKFDKEKSPFVFDLPGGEILIDLSQAKAEGQ